MARYVVNDKTQTVRDAEQPDERCNLDDSMREREGDVRRDVPPCRPRRLERSPRVGACREGE